METTLKKHMKEKPNAYCASLKGGALIIAEESGLLHRDWRGRIDITGFLIFWDTFSMMLGDFLEKGYDLCEMLGCKREDRTGQVTDDPDD